MVLGLNKLTIIADDCNSIDARIMTPIDSPDWHIKTDVTLAVLAQKAQTITYQALAQSVAIDSPHRIHKLTSYLETLIAADVAANAPIRAAVVISKIRGMPAPGFFDCLKQAGFAFDDTNKKAVHTALLRALNPAFEP